MTSRSPSPLPLSPLRLPLAPHTPHRAPLFHASLPLSSPSRPLSLRSCAGKLKDLGNTILGKFGMSLDNFKAEKDPETGSYSIRFQ